MEKQAKELRIVFMGTPEFAVPSLEALVSGGYNVVGVVTTPDRPQGRGLHLQECDVKAAAKRLGIDVILQPEKLKDPTFLAELEALKPDLGIVIAFRMLPEAVWGMPGLGTFNLHASLLPQYRGAAPINWAIMNGETRTGVTTFLLNHRIDCGAIIGQKETEILPDENIGSLYDRLMEIGKDLVLETVEKIASGDISPMVQPQEDADLKPAPKIFREDCRIDFSKSGKEIVNLVRGLSPYPCAWGEMKDEKGGITSVKVYAASFEPKASGKETGTILPLSRSTIDVVCGDGIVRITDLQVSGKRRMNAHDLLLGFRNIDSYKFI